MTGATVTPPKSAWSAPAKGQRPSSNVNIMGVEAVTKRLDWLLRTGSNNNNPNEFVKLCILLSKGIDHAVEHNEISNEVSKRLPSLVKQVCQRRNGSNVDAAIMVLMISVKNACKIRWFSEKEAEELLDLFKELGNEFCGPGGNLESISVISTIMSRHCPQLKLGKILASLDVKPGFDAYVIDFFIPKILKISPGEKLYLLVTQTDKLDTSACMVNPQLVNFLLNGKGVERRTNISMDTGPQSPTDLTSMLKHGTNLLQAIGEFTGPCIIAVAFMSVTSLADDVTMQHNAQPDVTAPDPDSNKFEGQSRSSPTCPIRQQEFPPPFTCPPTQNWSRQNHAPRGSSGQLDPQSKKQPSIQPSSPLTQHVQAGVGNTADSWSRLDPQSRKQPSIQSSSPLRTQTQHVQAGVGNTADSRSQLDPFRKQPSMQSPSPLQTQTQHVQAGVGNTADSRSRHHSMSNAAARQEDKRAPDPRFVPVKLGTSGTGTPNPINGERGARAQVMEQGSQVGMTMQASPVGTVREKNWQPTARMRGSLSASAYKVYEDKIIKPTQAAQATGPPPGFTQQPQSTDSRNGHIPETNVPTTGASNQCGGGNDVERMNQTVWRWL